MSRCLINWLVVLGVFFGASIPSTARAQTLEQAYQREFAFLAAEKKALESRIAELDASGAEKIAAAKTEIDQLQGQVLGLSLSAERLSESLMEAEREADVAAEHSDVISGLLTQAAASLEKGGLELPAAKEDDRQAQITQLRYAFEQSLPLLTALSSVRKSSGAFVNDAGDRVEGTLIQVGPIASDGVSD
jgi:biopolymer transport protein ExbB